MKVIGAMINSMEEVKKFDKMEQFSKAIFSMEVKQEKGNLFGQMDQVTKVILIIIISKERELIDDKTEECILAIEWKIKCMVKATFSGLMGGNILEIINMIRNTVMVCFNGQMERHIMENE